MRRKHHGISTEEAYIGRIFRFILFHNKRHTKEMGAQRSKPFLRTGLMWAMSPLRMGTMRSCYLSFSTGSFRISLCKGESINVSRVREKKNLPVVLVKEEADE